MTDKSAVVAAQRHRPGRVFYTAPIFAGEKRDAYESPAARNKVLGVCAAIRTTSALPIVLTVFGDRGLVSWRRPMRLTRISGVCVLHLYTPGPRRLHRVFGAFSILVAAIALIRKGDKVLLYNTYPEHLLLALFRWLQGAPAVIDIEDAPRSDDKAFIGRLVGWLYPFFIRICADRYLTVSHHLGQQLGLKTYLPIYGVASELGSESEVAPKFATAPLRVGFGGSIMPDTGYDLFCAAVRMLALDPRTPPMQFIVSGLFVPGAFDALAAEARTSQSVDVTVFADLDRGAYRALAGTLDVGLCLKLSSTELGQTTFPSKVVEIAALGSLLVSTRVSDVAAIFDNDCAVLLDSERPEDLAAVLIDIARNPAASAQKAVNGRLMVSQNFGAGNVGTSIMALLGAD